MAGALTAKTTTGALRGISDGRVLAFKGIPYAAPPVGGRRFLPPAPVTPWPGIRDALEYGASCPQSSARPQGWSQEPSLSEDCLYLNVWTPGCDDHTRPVMVWLHGGGFSIGSGSWPVYDGAALVRRGDVVVVTVNHRLGIFGYLHLKELAEPEFASSGNAGMLDLVAALAWVRDNISAFGGDPSNVMIFGESGGGAKVSTLLAMPAARGLFHRAAVQSGPGLRSRVATGQATELARQVVTDLAAGSVQALQSVAADKLLEFQRKLGRRAMFSFSPVIDHLYLPEHPGDAIKAGTAADVPLIVGCNRDEATLFLAMDAGLEGLTVLDADHVPPRLDSLGEHARPIIETYRRTRPAASPKDLLVAIESDRMMRIPSIELTERKLAGGKAPVYMYLFCWAAGPLGSAHGYEIPFVFDNARPPVMPESVGRGTLATQMSEAWIAFARNGAPDHPGIPHWPAYSLQDRATMIFDRDAACVQDDPSGEERAAWQDASVPVGMPA
ncbi:MAG: carboxylesterase/lipase family protein [Chloroflexota bacterium]|nr:carboxylesterase/lipase family protein [Chloroflexota bacterium]